MSHPKFNYCPFCGSNIPDKSIVNYCPFCGAKLLLNDNKIQEPQCEEKTLIHTIVPVEQVVVDYNEDTEISFATYNKINLGKMMKSAYYSIILKDVPNRQSLVRKLEQVLLRGSFAISLAVDNMPSLLIYKTKGNDIMHLNEILIQEQASTSMIAGDFNHNPVIEELFSGVGVLSTQTQSIIKQMPVQLWVGDRIQGVFSNNYRENSKGVTVITDKSIYFLPNDQPTTHQRWFVRSYNVLSKVIMYDKYLEFTYKDVDVARIAFDDNQQLHDAYQCIHRATQIVM